MTTEFELIRSYRGAFTPEECEKLIDYIDNFEKTNLLIYDTDNFHQVDNKTINISNYDFPAYSQLASAYYQNLNLVWMNILKREYSQTI